MLGMEAGFLLSEFDKKHLGSVMHVYYMRTVPILLNQYTQLNGIALGFDRK